MAKVRTSWGDINMAPRPIESRNEHLFNIQNFEQHSNDPSICPRYDIQDDLMHIINSKNHRPSSNDVFLTIKQTHIISKELYYRIGRKLNKQQKSIINKIIMRK